MTAPGRTASPALVALTLPSVPRLAHGVVLIGNKLRSAGVALVNTLLICAFGRRQHGDENYAEAYERAEAQHDRLAGR